MNFQKKKWRGLAALIPGIAMIFLDQSILPVALPTIQKELGSQNVALQWSVNVYLLVIAMLVLIGGKLSDRIGHRKTFLCGMCFFTLSSAFCGVSQNIGMLIGARALQGVGAALIFPSSTALLGLIVPPHERGRSLGFSVSVGSLFLMLGPLIGGYLTELVSWRWIFWINLPIAIIGVVLTRMYLPIPNPGHQKIDALGFLFFAFCCSSAITALMQAQVWGWLSWETFGLTFAAIISLVLLLLREKRSAHPFLEIGLFKHPTFASINLSISIVQFVLMITVFRAIYFQEVLAYSPSQAGLLTFVSTAPILFLSPLAGYLSDKVSPKLPIAIGYLALIYSFMWFGFSSSPSLVGLLSALIAFGIGMPLIFTPSYSSAMGSVPPTKMGVAFGIVSALRNFAAALGLALIGLWINTVKSRQVESRTPQEAQSAGFSSVHFALGFLLIAAFAVVFILHRRKSAHHLPEAPAEGWD